MAARSTKTQTREAQADASILKAILYLDSRTDYRECLAEPSRLKRGALVLLDDAGGFPWAGLRNITLAILLFCICLLLALRS